jgi:replication-associated recombination protein RarA
MGTQTTIDLGEARQNGLEFPLTLAEKYQPRIKDFVGLSEPKRVMAGLLKNPKPCNLLFVGPPGAGKSVMAMKFAEQLPAIHHHVRAQSADVATLDTIWERCNYIPKPPAQWHLVHVDEMDGATDKAQLQLLSRMDGTACLRPVFGGGFERGEPHKIINIFTCNGRTIGGQMKPPGELLPRFLSRCQVLYFEPVAATELAVYLKAIWKAEKGTRGLPDEFFLDMAQGVGVRDALMRMDSELLAPRTVSQVKKLLAEKAAKKAAVVNAEAVKWTEATPTEDELRERRSEAARKAWDTMRGPGGVYEQPT